MASETGDLLSGMKAICKYLSMSESTAIKRKNELDMPIRKIESSGVWVGSKKRLDEWSYKLVER